MPTTSRAERLQPSAVPELVAAATFPRRPAGHRDGVGIEAEAFVIRDGPDGTTERMPLDEAASIARAWADRERAVVPTSDHPALPGFALPDGTRITFEPGGQVEVSGACTESATDALSAVQDVLTGLASAYGRHDAALVSVGHDLWHLVDDVPQQLRAPRYPAMAAYFASRSDAGATMMRHTCSIQVNLDHGDGASAEERWTVANLVAPLATATFATSPDLHTGAASRRATVWRALDPTRTGFPDGLLAGTGGPADQLARAALDADVLLVRIDGRAVPGRPGWTFGDWLRDGDDQLGWPTPDDLAYHLTTLFHEVRPRGALEIRSVDALPARWRAVPVVLYVGLLYDAEARGRVRRVLEPGLADLRATLHRAAEIGLADASLCAAAVETWSFAIEGARRLGEQVVAEADVRRAEAFIERFTMRGRSPGDELRELFAVDPVAARSWATEPVPTVALC